MAGKLVWAIDAFDSNKKLKKTAIRMLKVLSDRAEVEIEPIYVLNSGQLNLSEEWVGPSYYYRPAAEKTLKNELSDVHLSNLQEPHIIMQHAAAQTDAVMQLSDYAVAKGAEFIVVGTHGRSGVKRILLGSFAESLLLRSKVPVMVVGPHIRRIRALDRIIFPTEFGLGSKKVFRKVVQIAKKLRSKLILFHSIPHPIEPLLQSGVSLLGGAWLPVQSYFGDDVNRQRKRANAWVCWAKAQGVEAEAVVHTFGGSVASNLLELSRRMKVGCIIMEAQSGPIASAIIGSVTRQVIRSSTCPVWIIRHSMLEKGQGKSFAEQKLAS